MNESEVSTRVTTDFKKIEGKINDKASTLTNMSFAIGAFFGPILGGFLTDLVGYRNMTELFALLAGLICLLNFGIVFLP